MTEHCPECQTGILAPRLSGFLACEKCGKLVVKAAAPESTEPVAGAEMEIPDFTEVCVGWRAWRVPTGKDSGFVPLLRSVIIEDYRWEPGQPQKATCHKDHRVPDEPCMCGLYSAKTREHLESMPYHHYGSEFRVMGTVNLWGKVIECSSGWRSEFAYPRELFVPYEANALAAPLAEAYGVPVRLSNILTKTKE